MSRKLFFVLLEFILLSSLLYIGTSPVVESTNDSYVWNFNTGLSYATIQEAINANETLDGHKLDLALSVFYEHVVVNKSVSLEGPIHIGYPEDISIIDGSGTGAVVTVEADDVFILRIKIRNGTNGIVLEETNNSTLLEVEVVDNAETGIYFNNSRNSTLKDSNITNNYNGIRLEHSSNNTISGNSITENNENGIISMHANHDTISGNNITENYGYGIKLYGNDISAIFGNNIRNNGGGICLIGSSNNTVSGNSVIEHNWAGIWLYSSSNNTVSGNNIAKTNASGIELRESSDNNSISGNNITSNDYGIRFSIDWSVSSNNIIYHNNFLDNTEQVYGLNSTNVWDDGYPSGGNYWSDYKERYPNATEIDGSGIWNTPYVIDENNQDNYPIVPEFPSFLILLLFMITTLLTIIMYRRKHST